MTRFIVNIYNEPIEAYALLRGSCHITVIQLRGIVKGISNRNETES